MARMNVSKSKLKRGAISFPQLASAGAYIELLDKGGNVVGPLDPSKTTVAWTSSDPTVISVAVPDPADTGKATLNAPGKAGNDVTITAEFTNVDGSPSFPPATSAGIDVPAGPPQTASIVIGTPTTP